jgi:hypothetical protein
VEKRRSITDPATGHDYPAELQDLYAAVESRQFDHLTVCDIRRLFDYLKAQPWWTLCHPVTISYNLITVLPVMPENIGISSSIDFKHQSQIQAFLTTIELALKKRETCREQHILFG